MLPTDLALDVLTPLDLGVQCSAERWGLIVSVKHPALEGRIDELRLVLADPDEVRRSQHDRRVLLFHRRSARRWLTAVVRYDEPIGSLVTAYPADRIKAGELVWTR